MCDVIPGRFGSGACHVNRGSRKRGIELDLAIVRGVNYAAVFGID